MQTSPGQARPSLSVPEWRGWAEEEEAEEAARFTGFYCNYKIWSTFRRENRNNARQEKETESIIGFILLKTTNNFILV